MENPVAYAFKDGVATLTMDDGKANAVSSAMQDALNAALEEALADKAVVVLGGRAGTFCAGFHLPTLMAGGPEAGAKERCHFRRHHRPFHTGSRFSAKALKPSRLSSDP